ncbi:hypothetical protein [Pseudomonas synxantha]|uniref:hypothetical protein n=1 Tax=Pseudomonas synxantha TaxID=47883 RepID=UPI0006144C44|nr:hypothetical protein [Pseudomonas synxantha]
MISKYQAIKKAFSSIKSKDEVGKGGTLNDTKKYIYHPHASIDMATKFLTSARILKTRGKAPYILVFESAHAKDQFGKALLKASSKKETNEHIKNSVKSLSQLQETDVLYISAHGNAGSSYFNGENNLREEAASVADTVANTLKLPPSIRVKVLTCNGSSTTEIIFPKDFPYPEDGELENSDKVKQIYDFLDKGRGNFSETLAGQFEEHLRQHQPSRARGLVSGYIGMVSMHSNNDALARTRDGGWEKVSGRSLVVFKAITPDGEEDIIYLRRRDVRRNALDTKAPMKTAALKLEKLHYVM